MPQDTFDSNTIATNAITGKLNEVSKVAEALDIALRGTQSCFDMDRCRSDSDSLDRKTEGNTSIDSRDSIDVSPSFLQNATAENYILFCSFTGTQLNSKTFHGRWFIPHSIRVHIYPPITFIGIRNGIRRWSHVTVVG